jgi:GH15 family glucan-1,4-alpha-glucosidase
MVYLPIENYGVIGDLHTVALIGMNGSVDWLCYPHFNSPTVFASILDEHKGGHFKIAPTIEEVTHKQIYWPDTNVLITRFLSLNGVGEAVDFMPIGRPSKGEGYHRLIRRIKVNRGLMTFRMECFPAFNYARDKHETVLTEQGASFYSPSLSLGLGTTVPLTRDGNGVVAEFTLQEGEEAVFILREIEQGGNCAEPLDMSEAEDLFKLTIDFWHRWLSQCTYHGRWREMVYRSALVLKLLTFQPTGAIVAAPTCSLPESIGGGRNWDYRYTWFRDAAFTLYGLLRIGFTDEAAQFMNWLEARCLEPNEDGSLQIVYGINGEHDLSEVILDHLEGYKGSRPVRIGNGAYNQLQLDIYGELLDSVYLYNKYGTPISYELWQYLRKLTNWVCDNWQRKDEGIWEVRSGKQDFVYSRLMCWVAIDRSLRLADKRSFPADRGRWYRVRDEIYEDIMTNGWSENRQAFVQAYGNDSLDAANLIMPLVFFLSPTDPKMLKTLDAINQLSTKGGLVSNGLVYRYDSEKFKDGLDVGEGTFNICTFWLVESLTRAGKVDRKRLAEARYLFEQMLGYANHLGLYAEQTGASGEALGNFPQAFTHLALISAAFNLDRALDSAGSY